jgi:hypothetical protein
LHAREPTWLASTRCPLSDREGEALHGSLILRANEGALIEIDRPSGDSRGS